MDGQIQFQGQTISREQFEEAQNYVETNKVGEMFRQGADIARTSSYNLNDSETKGYREAINASLNETQSLTEQRDVHLSNIERLSETQRAFTSESVESRQNLNQAFKNFVAEHEMQPGASRVLFVRASQGDSGARQQLDEYRDKFVDTLVSSSLDTGRQDLSEGFRLSGQQMKNDANIGGDYASDRTSIIAQGQGEAPGTDPTPVMRATHGLANRASEETQGDRKRVQTVSQGTEGIREKAGDNAFQGADEWLTGGRAGQAIRWTEGFLSRRGLRTRCATECHKWRAMIDETVGKLDANSALYAADNCYCSRTSGNVCRSCSLRKSGVCIKWVSVSTLLRFCSSFHFL